MFEGNGVIKNFPGNYSAYNQFILEKEKEFKKGKAVFSKPKSSSKSSSKPKKQKLSYKETKEFEQLEIELELLSAEKNEIETFLNTGKFQNDELSEKTKRLSQLIEIIDEKEMLWLELSEKQ